MRIHTNTLTSLDVRDAAAQAGATIETLTEHRSRTRRRAFNVRLTGNSRRRPNGGSYGAADDRAATWDQWGVFLGILFQRDPNMVTPYDEDAAAFELRTAGRFDGLDGEPVPFPLDHDHRFEYQPIRQRVCTSCGATAQR